ncbi:MAG TPA: CcdB family protein [Allosphingosinicella sp.]|jgi:toxin CcdB
MPQFDVYRNVGEPGYLLDCQSGALSGLTTRLVVPLLPPDYAPPPSRRLDPILRVGEDNVVMMTHFASAVPTRALGDVVGSLANDHMTMMNAFDMLLTGY